MKKPKYIYTELGKEKLCIQCEEYYPSDTEFFYGVGRYTIKGVQLLDARCKACYKSKWKPSQKKCYDVRNRYNAGI